MIDGHGPWVLGVAWTLTSLTLVFVLLRIYTRVKIVDSFGIDDITYIAAYICLLLFSSFITAAACYGFGSPNPSNPQKAVLLETIAQNFVVLGMAVAKCSLGFFLLRVAQDKWQRISIWFTISTLMSASIAVLLGFWLSCRGTDTVTEAAVRECRRPLIGSFIFIGTACVVTDLFFAIFPWIIFWRLQMPPREKYIVLSSMSLGVFAAAFGIQRTTLIPTMLDTNYLQNTVRLISWSAAEISVTLICIGIPILRPLYKKRLNKLIGPKVEPVIHPDLPFPLHTIGGSPIAPPSPAVLRSESSGLKSRVERYTEMDEKERKIALTGPYNTAMVVGGRQSDEEALMRQQPVLRELEEKSIASSSRIHVVDEFCITSARVVAD